ncbi:hypothetical protein LMG29542_08709 [Paraburkholderia humisilvae]|uniref:Uncharacterized protein n=6 Tax=Paraburkholderia humisilvae TaxID=627669 RepID=A0A6J5FCY0_9BURK|nr:hypothetical protein LMG29542_08709 [Paraburkholderia humisilvae]
MGARQRAANTSLTRLTSDRAANGPAAQQAQQLVRRGDITTRGEAAAGLRELNPPVSTQDDRDALLECLEEAHANGDVNLQTYRMYADTLASMRQRPFANANALARAAAEAGENVQGVAQRFGVTGEGPLATLEVTSVNGPAGAAVRSGENVRSVAQRFGITREGPLATLEVASVNGPAGAAVRSGENVRSVAQRFGITGEGRLVTLEVTSVNGPAGAAVRSGENVRSVAQRFGITREGPLATLEWMGRRALR